MSDKEQTAHLASELENLIDRHRSEYEMTYAQVVGVLVLMTHHLCDEARRDSAEDD